jgi:hypothetical protein
LKKIDHVVTLLNRLKKLDFELDIEVVIAWDVLKLCPSSFVEFQIQYFFILEKSIHAILINRYIIPYDGTKLFVRICIFDTADEQCTYTNSIIK